MSETQSVYSWSAVMKDGSVINEFSNSPPLNLNNIDITNLFRIELIPLTDVPPIIFTWADNRKLVYRKKIVGTVASGGLSNSTIEILTIGWTESSEEGDLSFLMHIYPNGSIELSNTEPSFVDEFAKIYLSGK